MSPRIRGKGRFKSDRNVGSCGSIPRPFLSLWFRRDMPQKKLSAKAKAAPKPKPVPSEATTAAVAALTEPVERLPAIPDADLLSTGCAVLNMAFSGRPGGGIPKGAYLYTVGDSGTLKTWLGFNLFAEAALNPYFDGYDFVFDNAENGALMDIPRYFGQAVLDRMRPPKGTLANPTNSGTVQEFYFHLAAATRRPCIYLLDSMDALNDDADDEKFAAELKHYETGKGEIPGSMGMAKAKTNSKNINRVVSALRDTGSILVVISQTRDKIGARFPTKTRGGGHALQFYAHLNVWTSRVDDIVRRYLRKDRVVGAKIKVDVRKNRVTGWEDAVVVHHLKEYGLDDIGSSVEYLLGEKHWATAKETTDGEAGEGAKFTAPEFDFTGTKEQLARKLIDEGREWDLSVLVARVWREIAAGATPYRKPRYGG